MDVTWKELKEDLEQITRQIDQVSRNAYQLYPTGKAIDEKGNDWGVMENMKVSTFRVLLQLAFDSIASAKHQARVFAEHEPKVVNPDTSWKAEYDPFSRGHSAVKRNEKGSVVGRYDCANLSTAETLAANLNELEKGVVKE